MIRISPIFMGLLILSLPSSLQAEPVSFSQAWQEVLRVSDSLQAETQKVNRALAEQEAGESLNLPSLDISGTYTHLQKPLEIHTQGLVDPSTLSPQLLATLAPVLQSIGTIGLTEQDVFRASLKALWPVYTGGRITAAQAIHEAQVAEERQRKVLTERELFTQLADRYYGVGVTQALTLTQAQLVDSLKEHFSHAKKLEEQGQIARVELLNAQVALENAKVSHMSAKRRYEMAKIALERMLHQMEVVTSSDLFMLDQAPSLPQLSRLTLTQHPALRLLEAKEAQAKGLIQVEKGSYKPTVFLYGNYTLYEDDSLFAQMEPDWLVGVGVSVPLLSRDGRSGKVLAAKSALLQATHTKAQTRQDLSLLVDQSYRTLLQAEEEYKALQVSLTLATENLRLRDLAFSQGLSTSIDTVDAELKLTAVKTQQLAAQYRYLQAYAKLMAVSGQLDEFIGRSQIMENTNAH